MNGSPFLGHASLKKFENRILCKTCNTAKSNQSVLRKNEPLPRNGCFFCFKKQNLDNGLRGVHFQRETTPTAWEWRQWTAPLPHRCQGFLLKMRHSHATVVFTTKKRNRPRSRLEQDRILRSEMLRLGHLSFSVKSFIGQERVRNEMLQPICN